MAPIAMNQHKVTGPNTAPIPPVPRFCTQNRAMRIAQVKGATTGVKAWVATSSPSTAESTEMAGVITPSPYRSAEPKSPSMMSAYLVRLTSCQFARLGFLLFSSATDAFGWPTRAAKAMSASTPPSPLLSARMT
jgi:hypothetical protein